MTMRFTCEKSMLVTGLNIAGRTVAQKSSLTAIEGILCKAGHCLSLTGYNMETAITYEIEADISDPGECILPARLFGDIIRRLPEGPVTVVVDEGFKVSIRAGYASFTIAAETAEDYPELPEVEDGSIILMHDEFESSVEAALQIVDTLQAEGYSFVTADDLLLK